MIENVTGAEAVRSNDAAHHSAPTNAQPGARATANPLRAWPVLLLALPAFVAIWSGWVGLGQLTGFGPVRPLPGIADGLEINSAITLPIGMETYASYALYVWLSGRIRSDRTRSYAKWSAFGSLILGAVGQVAYHLMKAAGVTSAPWPVTVLVACLPVAVLGMGAALAHMIGREHHTAPTVRPEPELAHQPEPVRTVSVREIHTETRSTSTELSAHRATPELDGAHQTKIEAPVYYESTSAPKRTDRWVTVAQRVCSADPAGRRDPDTVAAILRLRHEEGWSHARIAERVEVSSSTVTRTLAAAQAHTTSPNDE
ncbi:sigma-70 region 4 domain-containing protein [Nocardia amamiensis]|uniref:Sigma-70 region 4 domain-containing protein n=1 Tax=Nocardia amamiensis TaxID=404578 RepID=A0ABS0CJQ2_9NOCA|nr:sigma-70 region 4 domain-containing protein [Nocardia amamiensis]MBF6296824.1 sigma-70 region 4 domain-containing protein [Nocardia amamiensis]